MTEAQFIQGLSDVAKHSGDVIDSCTRVIRSHKCQQPSCSHKDGRLSILIGLALGFVLRALLAQRLDSCEPSSIIGPPEPDLTPSGER